MHAFACINNMACSEMLFSAEHLHEITLLNESVSARCPPKKIIRLCFANELRCSNSEIYFDCVTKQYSGVVTSNFMV